MASWSLVLYDNKLIIVTIIGKTIVIMTMITIIMMMICNGNWTELSAIWSEIRCMISKSNKYTARVWFEITSMILEQNCMTWSPITILFHSFWNCKIQSLRYMSFLLVQIFYLSSSKLVWRKLQKLIFILLQFELFLSKSDLLLYFSFLIGLEKDGI